MTCNEQSCHYATICTSLDKQKMSVSPWECSRYVRKGSPESFVRFSERGWV